MHQTTVCLLDRKIRSSHLLLSSEASPRCHFTLSRMMMMSFFYFCRNKNQPNDKYPKDTSQQTMSV
jgi:hypothetical protein